MLPLSRDEAIPRETVMIVRSKFRSRIFFNADSLIRLMPLPHSQSLTQDYFHNNRLSDIFEKGRLILDRVPGSNFRPISANPPVAIAAS
jgi:hypothetical protein